MEQATLFEQDISRGRHNEVSQLAFEQVREKITDRHRKIYALVNGIRCTREILDILGLETTNSGRFTELEKMRYIMRVGTKKHNGTTKTIYNKTLKEFPNE